MQQAKTTDADLSDTLPGGHGIDHYLNAAGPLAEQVVSLADRIDQDRQIHTANR